MTADPGESEGHSDSEPDEGGEYLRRAFDYGSDVAGSLAAAAPAFVLAGPIGAGLGAMAGPAVARAAKRIAKEFLSRRLGPRETARVGAVLVLTDQAIAERRRRGDSIRDDGFFTPDASGGRSAGEEVLEAGLAAAQQEHEEKKLPYLSLLLTNLDFDTAYTRAHANRLIQSARELSYQQFVLLSLFGDRNRRRYNLPEHDYRGGNYDFSQELIGVMQETYDLFQRGMLTLPGDTLLGLTDVNPGKLTVQASGGALYSLMELERTPLPERSQLAAVFRSATPRGEEASAK